MKLKDIRKANYKIARTLGDVNAVQKGRIGKRIQRRVVGRIAGKLMGKLLK